PHFASFGEIYFSQVLPGIVKAWKNHRRMTANYACVHGLIKLVLWDDRQESTTRGALMEVWLGPDDHKLAVIPAGICHGFQGRSGQRRWLVDRAGRRLEQRPTARGARHRSPARSGPCRAPGCGLQVLLRIR